MRITCFLLLLLLLHRSVNAQPIDSIKTAYFAELKIAGKAFSNYFYPNYNEIYALPEEQFIAKIDSARKNFFALLYKHQATLPAPFVEQQQIEIKYYFDKLLIDYPDNHAIYTGNTTSSSNIPALLQSNIDDFNDPALLSNSDFTNYVRSYLSYELNKELNKHQQNASDNQHLSIIWQLIPKYFSNPACTTFWKYDYLYNHIDNNGIKHIESFYKDFTSGCTNTSLLNKLHTLYADDSIGRSNHIITTYKQADNFNLDMHLFLPDTLSNTKHPAIIFFHGGSWSEGKPDWFFDECSSYAKKGWVACAVEYRTFSRYGTLPFAAVTDAKSAIRWLRQQAARYNIDTAKIVASGNSAGGHLVLCTALANKWNDEHDDITINASPNVLLINAGVYDLTDMSTAWIRKDLKNKTLTKEISPLYLVRATLPPTLIIHGTKDNNVPFASAKAFTDAMQAKGNTTIQFEPLTGASHFIWFNPQYAPTVNTTRNDFLSKLGYR